MEAGGRRGRLLDRRTRRNPTRRDHRQWMCHCSRGRCRQRLCTPRPLCGGTSKPHQESAYVTNGARIGRFATHAPKRHARANGPSGTPNSSPLKGVDPTSRGDRARASVHVPARRVVQSSPTLEPTNLQPLDMTHLAMSGFMEQQTIRIGATRATYADLGPGLPG